MDYKHPEAGTTKKCANTGEEIVLNYEGYWVYPETNHGMPLRDLKADPLYHDDIPEELRDNEETEPTPEEDGEETDTN